MVNSITEEMIKAIKGNQVKKLSKLQFDGFDLRQAHDDRKQNLLFYAIRQKAYDSLVFLIDCGLDVNQKNHFSDTPLHVAAYLGDAFMVKLLIQKRAGIDSLNKKHQTPLMQAALKGDLDSVKALVSKDANLNLLDDEGNHVLMYAVRSKKLKVVDYLIDAKAPLHVLNDKKESIMHIVAAYGLPSIFERLLSLGVNAYQKNIYLQTPLHYAVLEPMEAILDGLLAVGLNTYDKDRFNESPYDRAEKHNNPIAITKFTRMKTDPELQKQLHINPLHHALRYGQLDAALAYMHKISDVNQKDRYQNTPLFYALMLKDVYTIETLLKKGAKTEDISYTHHDALFYAVIEEDLEIFTLCLKYTKNLSSATRKLIEMIDNERFNRYI